MGVLRTLTLTMKTQILALSAVGMTLATASAFSLDFDGLSGTQLDSGSPLTFNIPGYGTVLIEVASTEILDVNSDFSIPGDGITEALEFDDGEAIQITFNNAAPSNVAFAYVGVDVGTEDFDSNVVNAPFVYSLEFDSTAQPTNTAGLKSITWTAVPEPSSAMLAVLGGLGLATRRRR